MSIMTVNTKDKDPFINVSNNERNLIKINNEQIKICFRTYHLLLHMKKKVDKLGVINRIVLAIKSISKS